MKTFIAFLTLSCAAQASTCPTGKQMRWKELVQQVHSTCGLDNLQVQEATQALKERAAWNCPQGLAKNCARGPEVSYHYYTANCSNCSPGWSPVCRISAEVYWCE